MNINNLTVGQIPQNFIRSNTVEAKCGMFANMLQNATESLNMNIFLGSEGDNSLNEDYNVEFEDSDENILNYNYENLNILSDIFFYRPNLLNNEVITDKVNVEYVAYENQSGIDNTNRLVPQEKQETALIKNIVTEKFILKNIEMEKLISKIEDHKEKSKIEVNFREISSKDMPSTENKIIPISDESTEIKSQVLSQVKDKIIITAEKGSDLNGIRTITMQLQPQNLGKVDIKMIFENNKLTVELKALNEETQKILSSNTGELKEMLSKTSESVKIVVKPYVEPDNHQIHDYQNNQHGHEKNFYQNNDHNQRQGKQRNNYYYNDTKEREEDIFLDLINLSTLKIKEGKFGN